MDFSERQRLLRRIMSGKLYEKISYNYEDYNVIFHDPTLDVLTEADWVYKKCYDDGIKENKILTLDQSYEQLIKDGKWSDKMEKEFQQIKLDLEQLKTKLIAVKFKKLEEEAIKKTIDDGKNRLKKLYDTKNQFWTSTLEFLCDRVKKRFIIQKITEISNKDMLFDTNFVNSLIVYYYEKNYISEDKIRLLARTDPWRLYWTVSKNTGTPIFPNSVVEMTEIQYALVAWTNVYDFAYQSQNRPSNDVINDDDKFDSWYDEECANVQNEINKNSLDKNISIGNGVGGQEVFIPADKEGSKEVYKINDPAGLSRIHSRQKALEDKGVIQADNLPDIQRDLRLEVNKMITSSRR